MLTPSNQALMAAALAKAKNSGKRPAAAPKKRSLSRDILLATLVLVAMVGVGYLCTLVAVPVKVH